MRKSKEKTYRSRQPSLFESHHLDHDNLKTLSKEWRRISRKTHGGPPKLKRKEFRPADSKKFVHLIMRSEKAVGELSFLRVDNKAYIDSQIEKLSSEFDVVIKGYANVGNHLHLQLKFHSKMNLQNFIRALSATVAVRITKSKRGKPFGKFWDSLAYTRVLTTRKEELQLRGYLEANRIEAAATKEARDKWLEDFNEWVATL